MTHLPMVLCCPNMKLAMSSWYSVSWSIWYWKITAICSSGYRVLTQSKQLCILTCLTAFTKKYYVCLCYFQVGIVWMMKNSLGSLGIFVYILYACYQYESLACMRRILFIYFYVNEPYSIIEALIRQNSCSALCTEHR